MRPRILSILLGITACVFPAVLRAQTDPTDGGPFGTSIFPANWSSDTPAETYVTTSTEDADRAWFVDQPVSGASFGISQDIVQLARAMNNDPARIYNFVRNEVESQLYFGLKKGPRMTLLEHSGNDLDKAVLLAALLKVSKADGTASSYANSQIETGWQTLDYYTGENGAPDISSLWRVDLNADPKGRYVTNESAALDLRRREFALTIAASQDYPTASRIKYDGSNKIQIRRFWLTVNGKRLDPWNVAYRRAVRPAEVPDILGSMNWSLTPLAQIGGSVVDVYGSFSLQNPFDPPLKVGAYWQKPSGTADPLLYTTLKNLVMSGVPGSSSDPQEGLLSKLSSNPDIVGKASLDNLLGRYKPVIIEYPSFGDIPTANYFTDIGTAGYPSKLMAHRLAIKLGQAATNYPSNDTPEVTLVVPALEGNQLSLQFNDASDAPIRNRRAVLLLDNASGSGVDTVASFTLPNTQTPSAVTMSLAYSTALVADNDPGLAVRNSVTLERNSQTAGQLEAMHTFFYGFTPGEGLLQRRSSAYAKLLHNLEIAHPGALSGTTYQWGLLDNPGQRFDVNRYMLGVQGLKWLEQTQLARQMLGDVFDANLNRNFSFGRMSQNGGYFVDAFFQLANAYSRKGNYLNQGGEVAAVQSSMMVESALEHSLIEQISPDDTVYNGKDKWLPAASTVNILAKANRFAVLTGDLGNTNISENAINNNVYNVVNAVFDGTGLADSTQRAQQVTNYTNRLNSVRAPAGIDRPLSWQIPPFVLWPGTVDSVEGFDNAIPQNGLQTPMGGEASMGLAKVIMRVGKANGGYSPSGAYLEAEYRYYCHCHGLSDPFERRPMMDFWGQPPVISLPSYNYPPSPDMYTGDPVNMMTGAFEDAVTDIKQGDGEAPRNFSFERYYSSSDADSLNSSLGYGWRHNWDMSIVQESSAPVSMGLGSVEQSATFLVVAEVLKANMIPVHYDPLVGNTLVINEDSRDPARWVAMNFVAKWAADQFSRGSITACLGKLSENFVALPDGVHYQGSIGGTMTLTRDDSTRKFTLQQRGGNTIVFNPLHINSLPYVQGKADTMTSPEGLEVDFTWVANGLSKVSASLGSGKTRSLTFTYDTAGSHPLKKVTFADTSITSGPSSLSVQYTYDAYGNLKTVTDAENLTPAVAGSANAGKSILYGYADVETTGQPAGVSLPGRLTSMTNAEGQVVVQNFYGPTGLINFQFSGGHNKPWYFRFGSSHNEQVDPLGGVKQYDYNKLGLLCKETDESGKITVTNYDEEAREIEKIDPQGGRVLTKYNTAHSPVEVATYATPAQTDPWKVLTEYDSLQRPTKVTDQLGRVTTNTYYPGSSFSPYTTTSNGSATTYVYATSGWATGLATSVTDRDGLAVTRAYNTSGYVFTETKPGIGTSKTFTSYHLLGGPLSMTDENGNVGTTSYNNRGQSNGTLKTDSATSTQYKTTTVYDAAGRMVRDEVETGRSGGKAVTTVTYTPTDKPKTRTFWGGDGVQGTADDTTETWVYDDRDWELQHTDYSGQTTKNDVLPNGWISKQNLPVDSQLGARALTNITFDNLGRPTKSSDVLNRETSVSRSDYEAFTVGGSTVTGARETTTDPMGYSISRWKDSAERLRKLTDARGKVYEMGYDFFNNPTSIKTPTGRLFTKIYSPAGKVSSESRNGTSITYQYQGTTGRLATTTFPDAVVNNTSYDNVGNLKSSTETVGGVTRTTSRTFDAFNRVRTYTNSEGWTIGYEYYGDGKLKRLWYPETRGDANPFDNPKSVFYDYDQSGHVTLVRDWNNHETHYYWRPDGKLDRIERFNGTVRKLVYDSSSRVLSLAERGPTGDLLWYTRYNYRKTDEIEKKLSVPAVKQTIPTSPWSATFDDDNGLASVSGSNSVTVSNDARGNVTAMPLSDAATFQNTNLTFDSRDRLTAIGSTSLYRYSQDGDRVTMIRGTDLTEYIFDPHGGELTRMLMKIKPDGSIVRCVWGLGLLSEEEAPAGGGTAITRVHHVDHTGASIIITDASGVVSGRQHYDPYGRLVSKTGTWNSDFGFGGLFGIITDPDGLVWMRARFYSPIFGRFLSMDPSRFEGGTNWYAYASGNPMSFADPTGLQSQGTMNSDSTLDIIQGALSVVGMAPGVGAVADLVNAGISFYRGNYFEAGVNLMSAIPGVGMMIAGGGNIAKGAAMLARAESLASETMTVETLSSRAINCGVEGMCFLGGTPVATEDEDRPIDSLHVGERVLTRDGKSTTVINPEDWRKVTMRMPNPECPSDILDIVSLRPLSWIAEKDCETGTQIYCDFEEMGLSGWAVIQSIEPCPFIPEGKGHIILSTFAHENTHLMDLKFKGQKEILHPTDRHRFFSVVKNEWIHAYDLHIGEKIEGRERDLEVESLNGVEGCFRVYNLEVEGDHNYFVGGLHILSHNSGCSAIGSTGKVGEDALKTLGGKSQLFFQTSLGGRFVDQMANGVANEAKTGYMTLTSSMRLQIMKDAELVQNKYVKAVVWNFFESPVTGKIGPSGPLGDFLNSKGIPYVLHLEP